MSVEKANGDLMKELETMKQAFDRQIASGTMSPEEIERMKNDIKQLQEDVDSGATISRAQIREFQNKHRDTLDWLKKN